jgi:hypothetical protein
MVDAVITRSVAYFEGLQNIFDILFSNIYKYTVGVLTVDIQIMWRGLETGERLAYGITIEVSMGFPLSCSINKLNNFFLQIVLQDKYNIGALTVNIKCMWLSTKRMEGLSIS